MNSKLFEKLSTIEKLKELERAQSALIQAFDYVREITNHGYGLANEIDEIARMRRNLLIELGNQTLTKSKEE